MARDMRRDDTGEVQAIEVESFTLPWTRRMFLSELENSMGWCRVVTDAHAQVAAYLICRFLGDSWHVMDLAVRKDVRARGLAAFLLDEFFEATDGGHFHFFLEVRPSNEEAIRLYESRGFEVAGRRPHYYHDTGEDALVMMRRPSAEDDPFSSAEVEEEGGTS